ncbi:2-amino-4-hydroxy-6-hydroxymethyldihydropteridine diphosphokinase [Salinivirga cyanobacteriivorans]
MFHKTISNKVVLLLGSNMEIRTEHLSFAINELKNSGIKITNISKLYESEAWGFEAENFINQVIIINTSLTPIQLLNLTQKIEKKAGRLPKTKASYESRPLDIDILFMNEQIIDNDRLKVPHPKIHERLFTLEPLNELIPEYKHPVLQKTIRELKKKCTDNGFVIPLEKDTKKE